MAVADTPKIAVIVLSYNNLQDTLACLASLERLEYPAFDVIVVDNASDAGVVDAIRAQYPAAGVLALAKNAGFSEGMNEGIRWAAQSDAEYFLLLNNDITVTPGFLSQLAAFSQSKKMAGIVGPAVLCQGAPNMLYALGGFIRWQTARTFNRASFEDANRYSHLTQPEQVDFVPGCAMLVSRRFIERCGLLDPDYFFNYEDVEWAVRSQRHGFTSWIVPSATVFHKGAACLGAASPANTYYMTRNCLRLFSGNTPRPRRYLITGRILLRTARTLAAWAIRPAYRDPMFRLRSKANVLAVRDFLAGRFGCMGSDVMRHCGVGR
jgi:GT2 family glycosyltransferase